MATPDELAEFQALSLKVSDRKATEEERQRWRELRTLLAKPIPTPPPMQVPRQHTRAAKKMKVAFAPMSALHATFTEEISAGGIKLRVPTLLELGTVLVVRLDLGEPQPLLAMARVAWCKRDGGHYLAGLEFAGLRDEDKSRIEQWLSVPASR